MRPVPDIIRPNLQILFIGFNPGERSALTGHHFAGRSNRFWKLLALSGLTPCQLRPEQDRSLLDWGYGITNIVARPSRTAAEITKAEYRAGQQILLEKLQKYRPAIACFAGIGVYREFARTAAVSCGRQSLPQVPGIIEFVLPSPSGLNRIPIPEQLTYYQKLADLAVNTPAF